MTSTAVKQDLDYLCLQTQWRPRSSDFAEAGRGTEESAWDFVSMHISGSCQCIEKSKNGKYRN